jgi:hypothetical protein
VELQTSMALVSAPRNPTETLGQDEWNRLPFEHPALEGLSNLSERTKSQILDRTRLAQLAMSQGVDRVMRWKPRRVGNHYTFPSCATLTQLNTGGQFNRLGAGDGASSSNVRHRRGTRVGERRRACQSRGQGKDSGALGRGILDERQILLPSSLAHSQLLVLLGPDWRCYNTFPPFPLAFPHILLVTLLPNTFIMIFGGFERPFGYKKQFPSLGIAKVK